MSVSLFGRRVLPRLQQQFTRSATASLTVPVSQSQDSQSTRSRFYSFNHSGNKLHNWKPQQRTFFGKDDNKGDGGSENAKTLNIEIEANSCSLAVPLPGGSTKVFATSPTLTVDQFRKTVLAEDKSVTSIELFNYEGDAISGGMLLGNILPKGFQVMMNDNDDFHWVVEKTAADSFNVFDMGVKSSLEESQLRIKSELLTEINASLHAANKANADDGNGKWKAMVEEMYSSFKSDQQTQKQTVETNEKVAETELALEDQKSILLFEYNTARWKSHDRWAFLGLGVTSVFWAGFARATFDIYSWDFMEPVTYFYTFGVQLMFMMYYIVWRHTFEFESWKSWHFNSPKLDKFLENDSVYTKLTQKLKELKQ